MKKKLLIIVGVVIVALAAGVVLYVVFKNDTNNIDNPGAKYGETADGFSVSVDKDGKLGVGNVVTKKQVTTAIGDSGSNISDPELSGVLRLGTMYSQTATYTFTMKNGKKASVNVDARTYPDAKTMAATGPFKGSEPVDINGIGDHARFMAPVPEAYQLTEPHETLIIVKDKTSYAVTLEQPRDGEAIDQKTARDIILKVAKVAKLNEVK